MHIELTEMLACPEPHRADVLVLSTAQMKGRIVQFGLVGCPVCKKEYQIVNGIVDFGGRGKGEGGEAKHGTPLPPDPTIQALLDLSGPGGFVVLVGEAARHASGLAALMAGIHFIGVNAPAGVQGSEQLSLLRAPKGIPLRAGMARGVVVDLAHARAPWLDEAARVLLRGRRLVIESSGEPPAGVKQLAEADGLWVGEKG